MKHVEPRSPTQQTRQKHLVRALLGWYRRNARDLPWRRSRDPYGIWVSEIMLQQTQVGTVVPYWERWMRELPDVYSLARCRFSRLHKLWEGLGYYSRVRNLQRAAVTIVDTLGGIFPRNYEGVLGLPGVGRYTAGAICSIAYNQPRPIVDGNVARVLARLFGLSGDPRKKPAIDQLWALAGELVETASRLREANLPACSHLNQSLMELGAVVCTPKKPACLRCPVSAFCVARLEKRVDQLPGARARRTTTRSESVAFVIEQGGRLLVCQRPAEVINAHLWEFPSLELDGRTVEDAARLVLGATAVSLRPLFAIRHSITRFRIHLRVFRVQADRGRLRPNFKGRWLRMEDLDRRAFSGAHRKIVEQLRVVGRRPCRSED